MIKKSQYIQLTLLILLVFVLFLLTATSISFQNDVVITPKGEGAEKLAAITGSSIQEIEDPEKEEYVVVIGGDNDVAGKRITGQLECLKRKYKYYKKMTEVPIPIRENMQQLILCSSKIEGYYAYEDIIEISRQGTDIIFATLPEKEELTQEWMDILGIQYMGDWYMQKGIISMDGFMVGGISWYEDYRVELVRIKASSSCKVYVSGMNDKELQEKFRNEDATDIVWRTILNRSRLFVINGKFSVDGNDIGILGSILSKRNTDYLYPIINAKMLFIEDAPYLSNENEEEMQKRYARNANRFLEEIVVPGIVSLCMSLEIQPQFYGTQYFQSFSGGIYSDSVSFLNRELIKIGGDIQISANNNQVDKVTRSIRMIESVTGKEVTSLLFGEYNEKMEKQVMSALSYAGNITSIIHNWKDVPQISIREGYTYIPMMTEGYDMKDAVLFLLDSSASSLGLITHGISMETMIYPKEEGDDWSTAFKDFSAYYYSACRKYSYLDGVDAKGLEQRVRQYLVMDPEIIYEKKKIHLKVENLYTQGYFILRTDKKVRKMSSGSYKKLEDGTYLLTITEQDTDIILKEK